MALAYSQLEHVVVAAHGTGDQNLVTVNLVAGTTAIAIRQTRGTIRQGLHAAMKVVGYQQIVAVMLTTHGATTRHEIPLIGSAPNLLQDADDRLAACHEDNTAMGRMTATVKEKKNETERADAGNGRNDARNGASVVNKRVW